MLVYRILNRINVLSGSKLAYQVFNFKRSLSLLQNIPNKMSYSVVERGSINSLDYRLYFLKDESPISPFHDIPLYVDNANKTVNMIVEIPRWTNAKMEINVKETLNPIKQDVKKGKLRFVANCFPHHGYIWNYGALPQTWENPEVLDKATGCKGDNDPIDVLEIGYRVAKKGEVLQVKVLGCLALIDEGETDWKIIVIDVKDPIADQLNDVSDIEKHFPGLMKATVEWFKIYKIPDGKPENQFAFNGEAKPRDFALNIIEEVNQHWQNLVNNKTPSGGIECSNVTVEESPFKISPESAKEILQKVPELNESPQPLDAIIDKWHYEHLK
ncbi:uncharacterized protein LOC127287269 [Leptopilina boulardi]|uniref:uncharacterized protein LOC127287269 n=1 Tax=Leptopilina boulardi TaxID=63433 RepID=UPI0021F6613F|nr:uncharacterized protein LOC127287269 [Leptopilina boulardi]